VVTQWGSIIYVFIRDGQWHRVDLERLEAATFELAARETEFLEEGQEVESSDMMWRERVLDRRLYLETINVVLVNGI
jgi:hypothetical protein